MLKLIDVNKSFGEVKALNGMSLHAKKGSVYGIIGPNGAGKSTAVRHMAGIYRQDSGQVLVGGEPVFENTEIKSKIAYVPDDVFCFPMATTQDMMQYYKSFYPNFSTERFEKLRELFDFDIKRPMRKLSRGMKKQAGFWLAFSMMPEVLILDEPVDGMDPVVRRSVWRLALQDVAERGTTMIVASHNLRELEDVCDTVGIIEKGKMLHECRLDEMQENVVKIQLAYESERELPPELHVLNISQSGKVKTLIVKGGTERATELLKSTNPLFMDVLNMSLEEIFIYELGGAGYEVKDIIL